MLSIKNKQHLIVVFCVSLPVLLSALNQSCQRSGVSDVQAISDKICQRYVPDAREGIAAIKASEFNGRIVLKGETDHPKLKEEILDSLSILGFHITDSIEILPTSFLGEYEKGIVTLSVINLRKEPSHNAELASQAIMGTPVKLLKSTGYWILVQTPDKYISWTETESLELVKRDAWEGWKKARKFIYTDRSGWIYENADNKNVISDIVAGCILLDLGGGKGWVRVGLPDGREGYVEWRTVQNYNDWKENLGLTAEKIIKTASGIMGIPYLWGGSSLKGVDCSGFVQTVFFQNGLILPRDASLQAMRGMDIGISDGWDNLEPGDLMFFGPVKNEGPRVTHVAIYIGNSEFIHSSGRVTINSLDSTRANYSNYRKNTFLFARRIIGYERSEGIFPVKYHSWY